MQWYFWLWKAMKCILYREGFLSIIFLVAIDSFAKGKNKGDDGMRTVFPSKMSCFTNCGGAALVDDGSWIKITGLDADQDTPK